MKYLKSLPVILILFSGLQSLAQIRTDKAKYRYTEPDRITFVQMVTKGDTSYLMLFEADGTKQYNPKVTIQFASQSFTPDSAIVTVATNKYIQTYNYQATVRMSRKLIDLILSDKILSYSIGNNTEKVNSKKYRNVFKGLFK
jgi:hypothetical protein